MEMGRLPTGMNLPVTPGQRGHRYRPKLTLSTVLLRAGLVPDATQTSHWDGTLAGESELGSTLARGLAAHSPEFKFDACQCLLSALYVISRKRFRFY
jgi:hypothetical protein